MKINKISLAVALCGLAYSTRAQPPSTDLLMWLRADSVQLTLSGSEVSGWTDLSGLGNHASQASASLRPSFTGNSAGLGGHGFVTFDGLDDFMTLASALNASQSHSVAVVFASTQTAVAANSLHQRILGDNSGSVGMEMGLEGGQFGFSQFTTKWNDIVAPTPVADGSFHLGWLVRDKVSGNFAVSADGQTPSTGSIAMRPNDRFRRLGGGFGYPQGTFNGSIAEILVYSDTLSAVEITQLEAYVFQRYGSAVDLGQDFTNPGLCDTTLDAGSGFASYLWSTGATSQTIQALSGTYSVSVTGAFGQTLSDTITITSPLRSLSDTLICIGDTAPLITGLGSGFTVLWNTGAGDTILKATLEGNYAFEATDGSGCMVKSDTIRVEVDSTASLISLGPDRTECQGSRIGVSGLNGLGFDYLWHNADTTNKTTVTTTGSYAVTVTSDNGCVGSDTAVISVSGVSPSASALAVSGCSNEAATFADNSTSGAGDPIVSWTWDFGNGQSASGPNVQHNYALGGTYLVELSITTQNGCSNVWDSTITVHQSPVAQFSAPPKATSFEPVALTNLSDTFGLAVTDYTWQFGNGATSNAHEPQYAYPAAGQFLIRLKVRLANTCDDSTTASIAVLPGLIRQHLAAWFVADSGVVVNGNGEVTQWQGISGNGIVANDQGAATRPKLEDSLDALNGHAAVRFDGADDQLRLSPFIPAGGDHSVIVVMRGEDASTASSSLHQRLLGDHRGSIGMELGLEAGRFGVSQFGAGWVDFTATDTVVGEAWEMGVVVRNAGTDSIRIYSNGQLNREGILASRPGDAFSVIGNGFGYGQGAYDGAIAEIVVYDTSLTPAMVQAIHEYIFAKYAPPPDLGPDVHIGYSLCDIPSLTPGKHFESYVWSSGHEEAVVTTEAAGVYQVDVQDAFRRWGSDTLTITASRPPFQGFPDTLICIGGQLTWNTGGPLTYDYQWSNGPQTPGLTITAAGIYAVTITDSFQCTYSLEPALIQEDSFALQATLGPDTTLCVGQSIGLLESPPAGTTFLWSTGATSSRLSLQLGGSYWVRATNPNGCIARDTIVTTMLGYPPIAEFGVGNTCLGDEVAFQNQSFDTVGAIISYLWNFGDTTSSGLINPTHTYADTGVYVVLLTVTSNTGCLARDTFNLRIAPLPLADFAVAPGQHCSGGPIGFTDQSAVANDTLAQWLWDFGDGQNASLQHPTHTFDTAGFMDVQLIVVTQNGCRDTTSQGIFLKPGPTLNIQAEPRCEGRPVSFVNTFNDTVPTLNWTWDFGDGQTGGGEFTEHTYDTAGTYVVTVQAAAFNLCVSEQQFNLVIESAPMAAWDASPTCVGNPVQFFDVSTSAGSPIDSVRWLIADDTGFGSPFSLSFADTGLYHLELQVQNTAGCRDTTVAEFKVHAPPVPKFEFDPNYGLAPVVVNLKNQTASSGTFEWFVDGQSISSDSLTNHLFASNGTFPVTLVVTGPEGCSDTLTKTIVIVTPLLDMAVTEVITTETVDAFGVTSMEVLARVINLGTRIVDHFDLVVQPGTSAGVSKRINRIYEPGQTGTESLGTVLRLIPGQSLEFICASVAHPNGELDDVPENNSACVTRSETFVVIGPYPNPSVGVAEVDIYMPRPQEVTVVLFDELGREVYRERLAATPGVAHHQVSLGHALPAGRYVLEVISGPDRVAKSWLLIRP